jgi:cell division septation protein DedD
VPLAVGRTAGAVSGLADSGLVHRLTRGRLWIGALTTLLVGIVALNVLALSLNASSSRVGMQADSLKRQISALRAEIATNGASNKRIQDAAANLGLIVPEPGAVGYLRHGADDATVAARRLASGELTSQALSVAPVPLSVPATTVAPPASTDAATVAQPATNSTEPATNTTTTPTTDAAAPPPAPAAGQGAGGAAVGGGGVSTP